MGNSSMYIAVQNPSSVDLSIARFPVENGVYNATVFNMSSQQFEHAPSTLICHNDSTLDLDHIDSCFLSVKAYTPTKDFSLMKIEKVSSSPSQPEKLIIGKFIETKNIKLQFAGFSTGDSMLQFQYVNKQTNQTEFVYVSLAYWSSYVRHDMFSDHS